MGTVTRTILTSQPVLSCDVCARSLLRGEHHEIFVQAGERRTVCELCAPRATAEGWLRERDGELGPVSTQRRRRGLLERMRALAVGGDGAPTPAAAALEGDGGGFDLLAGPGSRRRITASEESPARAAAAAEGPPTREGMLAAAAGAFNDSEFPRRVAGLARSLGAPSVSVHVAEHLDSAARVVVAWELCWYRYEVDFSEDEPLMRALAQGNELAELDREERTANAVLSADGTIELQSGA